jgi:hypothetical protein
MTGQGGVFGYAVPGGPDCAPDTAYVTVTEIACNGIAAKPYALGSAANDDGVVTATNEHGPSTELRPWPVPATEFVQVPLPASITSLAGMQVLDATGRAVKLPMTYHANTVRLDVRELPAGAYQLVMLENGQFRTARFLRARD